MARLEINMGTLPTGTGGDIPRSANIKINAIPQELYDTKNSRFELQTKGLAGSNFFAGNIDLIGNTTGSGLSTYQLTGETSGTRPAGWPGLHGGLLESHVWDANTAMQNLCIGGSNYNRFFTGGAWSE